MLKGTPTPVSYTHLDVYKRQDLVGKDRKLHWWSFIALFSGLSDDTKIVQIMSIRSRPLPKPTKFNAEERRQLMKLKHLYRLELSEGERKQQFQKGLAKVAIALQGLAQKMCIRDSNKALRVKDFLVQNYGGQANEWQHSKARTYVDTDDGPKKAVIHWFYEESVGVKETFVKGLSLIHI